MRDIVEDVLTWRAAGREAAVATVIATEGSTPRGPGSCLAVRDDGVVVGSVSGGCVEPAVYERARTVLTSGAAIRDAYGISVDEAFEVGLTCGGTVHVFVFPVDDDVVVALTALRDALVARRPVALATVVEGPQRGRMMLVGGASTAGTLGNAALDRTVAADAEGMVASGERGLRSYGPAGEPHRRDAQIFVDTFAPRPAMYVFGAIDHAAAVVSIGRFLGYRVTVCDAREPFATRRRFPDADDVAVAWPHEFLASAEVDRRTAICVFTHDPKFDVPLLQAALGTPAGYIGAMGSRRTHDSRIRALRRAGISEDALGRIASPIGLDIGATTPEEVAISVAAEIIALRYGAPGGRLAERPGPIHRNDVRAFELGRAG